MKLSLTPTLTAFTHRGSMAFAVMGSMAFAVMGSMAFAATVEELTPEDFYGASYFKTALKHPEVSSIKSKSKQIAVVARDMGWNRKKLKSAIDKVTSLEGDPVSLAKNALEEAFRASRVQGRVLDVLVNDSEPKHVVCYVKWRGSKGKEAVKEASTIAHLVAEHAPFVSTLSLAAIHPSAPESSTDSVWEAKIGRTSMTRISERRIDNYADRLYGRMFEEVKAKPF